MKRIIYLSILLAIIILLTSCTRKEAIALDFSDQIVALTQLSDRNLEGEYEKAVVNPIIFTSKAEYEKFANQYFIEKGMKDFDYKKYDLIFINVKKVTTKDNTLYSVNSISKLRNTIEVVLKVDGRVTSENKTGGAVIENVLYVRINKGIISSKSNFVITKK